MNIPEEIVEKGWAHNLEMLPSKVTCTGLDKENFLKSMEALWDEFEELNINRILGFNARAGKPITIIRYFKVNLKGDRIPWETGE